LSADAKLLYGGAGSADIVENANEALLKGDSGEGGFKSLNLSDCKLIIGADEGVGCGSAGIEHMVSRVYSGPVRTG
jgi:hypothetical protein